MNAPALPKRYSIASLLGEGGQGRVYRVRDSLRDRDLAIKLVSASDSEFLRREFDTLRQIRHENLIQVFDWGTLESGEAYYTMELVEGDDWNRFMGVPQSTDEVRRILTGLLRGLAHLHCHGEIHGDLKPANILLGQGGVVKVTDVGMGHSERGAGGGIAGTPGYTAPECWEGKPADVRSDLYSVGVMAYEALTGKHPFAGRTIREVVAGQMEGWAPSPAAHRVAVAADLERVVMRALEREASLRQGSADEFMEGFGVEDRVGVILGGRFVGREAELDRILDILFSENPRRESLFRIVGPPGSGKAAVLREVAHRLSKRGIKASTWEEWRAHPQSGPSPNNDVLQAILIGPDGAQEEDRQEAALRAAREAWATAVESGVPSRTVYLTTSVAARSAVEPCEFTTQLQPLTIDQLPEFLEGMIGRAILPGPLIARIHAITGGMPESVATAVRSLVGRGLVARRDSRWQFNETTEIRSLTIPEVASPWKTRWPQLSQHDRDALLLVALSGGRLRGDVLRDLDIDTGVLRTLEARGDLNARGDVWALASEGMQVGLLEAASDSETNVVARRLLQVPGGLGLEQEADILLRLRDPAAIGLAVRAAEVASARGEHYLAMRRYRECRGLAISLSNLELADECALREAEALNQVGRFSEASSLLEAERPESLLSPQSAASRHHLLGIAMRGVGDLDAAAGHFESALQIRSDSGDRSDALWSLCELAEIRWQFGGLDDRKVIVDVLRSKLNHRSSTSLPADLKAALSYHLGAALLELGALDEANLILESASLIEASPYWKMRIRIAEATAEHRSGNSDRALVRIDEAWAQCEACGADAYRPRILTNRGAAFYQLGKFRESMVANTLGLDWARRVGNLRELLFAASGTAACNIILGEYGPALRDTEEATSLAEIYGDPLSVEKALELKSWIRYWLGDLVASEEISKGAIARFGGWTTTETRPRLYWALSKVKLCQGEILEAREWLDKALELVRRSGDPEDLPGIEIEVLRLEGQAGNEVDRMELIRRIRDLAGAAAIPTVVTLGAVAIGEILLWRPHGFEAQREFLLSALASAESSEIAEASWRINFYLGALSRAHGDDRNTRTRFSAALKGLRRIADRLESTERSRYLDSPHVRPLLTAMSTPSQ